MTTTPRSRLTLAELLAGSASEPPPSDAGGDVVHGIPGSAMGPKRRYTLAELVAGITPENCHPDAWGDNGLAFGCEFGAEAGGFAPVGCEFGAPGGEAGDRSVPGAGGEG